LVARTGFEPVTSGL